MKLFLPIYCWLWPTIAFAQVKDSLHTSDTNQAKQLVSQPISPKAEILNGGFIDIVQNGQMNASARLFRLYIGEPGKFQVPVSVYTGVTANNFSTNPQTPDHVLTLINPGSGIFNMSFDGSNRIIGSKKKITTFCLQYQAGFRFLSIYNRAVFRNENFFNTIGGLGFTFITGAWEKDQSENIGIYWLNIRGIFSGNPSEAMQSLFMEPVDKHIWGYSTGMGIEISKTLHVKIFYFRFLTNRGVDVFSRPFLQLSVNYSVP